MSIPIRILIAMSVATIMTAWARWSPFAPAGSNEMIQDNLVTWGVAAVFYIAIVLLTLRAIKVIEEEN